MLFESKSAAKFFYKYSTPQAGISYQILPSTSGLHAEISFDQKVEMWKIVAETANGFKLN